METSRKAAVFILIFVAAAALLTVILPKETPHNDRAAIRTGAGDDISGILMEETAEGLKDEYAITENLESTSFHDC